LLAVLGLPFAFSVLATTADTGGEQKRTEEWLLAAQQKREAAQLFESQEKTTVAKVRYTRME
jgi:hypothetical protein